MLPYRLVSVPGRGGEGSSAPPWELLRLLIELPASLSVAFASAPEFAPSANHLAPSSGGAMRQPWSCQTPVDPTIAPAITVILAMFGLLESGAGGFLWGPFASRLVPRAAALAPSRLISERPPTGATVSIWP